MRGSQAFDRGDYEQAQVWLDKAYQAIQASAGSFPLLRHLEQQALVDLGRLDMTQGNLALAERRLQEALSLARHLKKPVAEIVTRFELATLWLSQGKSGRARSELEMVRSWSKKRGFALGQLFAEVRLAGADLLDGQYEEALTRINGVIDKARVWGLRANLPTLLRQKAYVLEVLQDDEEADTAYEEALAIAQKLGMQRVQAQLLLDQGWLWFQPEDYLLGQRPNDSRSRRSLAACREAKRIADQTGDKSLLSNAHVCIASIQRELGNLETAYRELRLAETVAQSGGSDLGVLQARIYLGDVLLAQKRCAEAYELTNEAIEFLDRRDQPPVRAFVLFLRSKAAWCKGERESAKLDLEQAVQVLDAVTGALSPDLRRTPFEGLLPSALRGALVEVYAEMGEKAAAFAQASATKAQVFKERWQSSGGGATRSLTLGEVKKAIPQDTSLVTFFVRKDKTYSWVVSGESAVMVPLAVKALDLRAKIDALKNHLGRREDVGPLLAELHEILWQPLAPKVTGSRVFLVPHGPLHDLPFAALPGSEPGRFLAEEKILIRVPFAEAALGIPSRTLSPSARALILAGSNLPQAAPEARQVAALYDASPRMGPEATEAEIHQRIGQLDLLHIAAHGRIRSDRPRLSYVELAEGGGHDGRLTFEEIRELDLSELDLTVLSVCESSAGEPTGGDEIQSLARAFLSGGNGAVVTAAWSIQDEASRALMQRFHHHVREGTEVAEALALAQRYMLQRPGWRHPYYWAAFQVHDAG